MRAMLALAAFAGLRCQEIAGLDRDDIIEAKGLIRVRFGKGAKERIVPIHPDVMEALRCLPLPRTGAIRAAEGRASPSLHGQHRHRRLSTRNGHKRYCPSAATLVRQ